MPAAAAGALRSSGDPTLLPRALGYLSAGLQQSVARDRAAISVREIATSCERAIVTNPVALEALLQVRHGMHKASPRPLASWSVRLLPRAGLCFFP